MVRTTIFIAILLGLLPAVWAGEGWPRFRHVNYVAFEAAPDEPIEIRLKSVPIGKYTHVLTYRILNSKSDEVAGGEIEIGGDKSISYAAREGGLHVLEITCGWNSAVLSISAPHAIVSHGSVLLKTVGPLDKLYFYVPTGAKKFSIYLQASVTKEGLAYKICDPEGKVVSEGAGDFDKCEKIPVSVSPGADGKAWSLSILPPNKPGMGLDDTEIYLGDELAPYLAEKPEWAIKFGKRKHP